MDKTEQARMAQLFASQGVAAAQEGNHVHAIKLFSSAIEIDDTDYRFFVNRSFCYYNARLFEQSVQDADRSIELEPESAKTHYRKALALAGLQKYNEAEVTFNEVLRRDPTCESSQKRRIELRYVMLRAKGLDESRAQEIAEGYYPVELYPASSASANQENGLGGDGYSNNSPGVSQALNAPSAVPKNCVNGSNILSGANNHTEEIRPMTYCNGGDEISRSNVDVLSEVRAVAAELVENDVLKKPTNLLNYHALKVSNLSKNCNRQDIWSCFSAYGTITKLGIIKNIDAEWITAVIHYDNALSPIEALAALRDVIMDAKMCCNPLRPLIMWFTPSLTQKQQKTLTLDEATEKIILAGECFDWRGPNGCSSRGNCNLKHIRINSAIDCHLEFIMESRKKEKNES